MPQGMGSPAIGNISVSGADGAILDGVSSSIKATVFDYANSNPVAVRLTDTSGDYVAAGGTQYTEGDTDASITGTAALWEDDSNTLRAVSAVNALPIRLKTVQGNDINLTDDGAYVTGEKNLFTIGGVMDDSSTDTVDEGDVGYVRMSTRRELYVQLRDAAGNERGLNIDSSGAIAITNAGTFAVQVDGSALTALQLIDDAVYVDDADWTADTSKHALVGSVTQVAPTANTDGDTTPLISDGLRQLRVAALESDLATAGTSHVKKYYTNAGAVTDGIIWSPAVGKRWYLTHLSINVSAAATVTIEDDLAAGDSAVYKAEFAANSGVVLTFPEVPMFSGEDAADLIITTSAGNVYVTAVGYEI